MGMVLTNSDEPPRLTPKPTKTAIVWGLVLDLLSPPDKDTTQKIRGVLRPTGATGAAGSSFSERDVCGFRGDEVCYEGRDGAK
jgi:hypothetical protein